MLACGAQKSRQEPSPPLPCSADPRFIPQIVSSAIMNAPPPFGLIRLMHRMNYARE